MQAGRTTVSRQYVHGRFQPGKSVDRCANISRWALLDGRQQHGGKRHHRNGTTAGGRCNFDRRNRGWLDAPRRRGSKSHDRRLTAQPTLPSLRPQVPIAGATRRRVPTDQHCALAPLRA